MPTLTCPLSVPQMLRTILLAASLSAQNGRAGDLPCGSGCAHLAQDPGDGEAAAGPAETQPHSQWDNPICTEGVVSVSRGERAVMACNISNPFLSVTIYLSSHGKNFKPIFSMRPTGCFCQGGWRLQVQGSVAQLVINDASHTQAGSYRWHLQGLQRNIKVTTLNVSGAESQDLKVRGRPLFTHPYSPETPRPSKARDQFRVAPVVIGIIASLVFLVVIGARGLGFKPQVRKAHTVVPLEMPQRESEVGLGRHPVFALGENKFGNPSSQQSWSQAAADGGLGWSAGPTPATRGRGTRAPLVGRRTGGTWQSGVHTTLPTPDLPAPGFPSPTCPPARPSPSQTCFVRCLHNHNCETP
ncbi:secreted and transmembrane protein 1 isoform X2 [Leptonychotes weddellii]|uniref:Secreted and transmembrane protein 1 isoform X2 n=1 Tax=Leptonychotes weddellii TaxID=9713 RepID=A0A7F8RFZ6_LEPWE|nr:secreted and transmembrane protein 1 isoform X2 [Leptonychotes weddellii]